MALPLNSLGSLPPTHGGSFTCVKRVVLELPTRALSPRQHLRSRGTLYLTSCFWEKIFPGLASRPEVKPSKEGELLEPPQLSLLFWRNSSQRLTGEDLSRRFIGKECPLPWVGINPLFEWYDHWPDERPFSMDSNGLIFFIEHKNKAEEKVVSPIHVFGKYGSLHSQWWVDHFGNGDNKALCPPEATYVSVEETTRLL